MFSLYALIEYAVQRLVLLPAFVRLEEAATTSNTQRAVQALEREGRRPWGLGYDFNGDRELAMGELSAAQLPPDHPLRGGPKGQETAAACCVPRRACFSLPAGPSCRAAARATAAAGWSSAGC